MQNTYNINDAQSFYTSVKVQLTKNINRTAVVSAFAEDPYPIEEDYIDAFYLFTKMNEECQKPPLSKYLLLRKSKQNIYFLSLPSNSTAWFILTVFKPKYISLYY